MLSRPIYSYALGVYCVLDNWCSPDHRIAPLPVHPLPGGLQPPPSSSAWRCWCRCGWQCQFSADDARRLRDLTHSYPLMFIFVGVIGYVVGSTQGTFEALPFGCKRCGI